MLIYTRNDRTVVPNPVPPDGAVAIIEKKNAEFAKRREQYFKEYAVERARIQIRCNEYQNIAHALPAKPTAVGYLTSIIPSRH